MKFSKESKKYKIILDVQSSKRPADVTCALEHDTLQLWQVNCLRRHNKLPTLNDDQIIEHTGLLKCKINSPYTVIKAEGQYRVVKNEPKYHVSDPPPAKNVKGKKPYTPSDCMFNVAKWMQHHTTKTKNAEGFSVKETPIPQYNDTVYNEIVRRIRLHLSMFVVRFKQNKPLTINLTGVKGFTRGNVDEILFTLQATQDLAEKNATEMVKLKVDEGLSAKSEVISPPVTVADETSGSSSLSWSGSFTDGISRMEVGDKMVRLSWSEEHGYIGCVTYGKYGLDIDDRTRDRMAREDYLAHDWHIIR